MISLRKLFFKFTERNPIIIRTRINLNHTKPKKEQISYEYLYGINPVQEI